MIRKLPKIFFICWLAFSGQCLAAPDCYENARIPAHEFVFQDSTNLDEVTSLAPNGKSCVQVKFWKGEPLLLKPLYVPFGSLYASYARAIEEKNVDAAKKLYAYVQPTPRSFSDWLWLANDPQGPPQPWGMEMLVKIMGILQPHASITETFLSQNNPDMALVWPTIFFFMRGVVYPDNKWIKSAISFQDTTRLLSWRYPCYLPEQKTEKKDGKKEIWLRLP